MPSASVGSHRFQSVINTEICAFPPKYLFYRIKQFNYPFHVYTIQNLFANICYTYFNFFHQYPHALPKRRQAALRKKSTAPVFPAGAVLCRCNRCSVYLCPHSFPVFFRVRCRHHSAAAAASSFITSGIAMDCGQCASHAPQPIQSKALFPAFFSFFPSPHAPDSL